MRVRIIEKLRRQHGAPIQQKIRKITHRVAERLVKPLCFLLVRLNHALINTSIPRFVGVHKGNGQKSWDQWFQPYFQLIRDNPGIKAFCYINWDWKKESDRLNQSWGNWGDARIEENDIVAENYRKEIERFSEVFGQKAEAGIFQAQGVLRECSELHDRETTPRMEISARNSGLREALISNPDPPILAEDF